MYENDLSPTLGGGPLVWAFEERRPTTVFKMPATLAAEAALREHFDHLERINREMREAEVRMLERRVTEAEERHARWSLLGN